MTSPLIESTNCPTCNTPHTPHPEFGPYCSAQCMNATFARPIDPATDAPTASKPKRRRAHA